MIIQNYDNYAAGGCIWIGGGKMRRFSIIYISVISNTTFLSLSYLFLYLFSPYREQANFLYNTFNVNIIFPQFFVIFLISVVFSYMIKFLFYILQFLLVKIKLKRNINKNHYILCNIIIPIIISFALSVFSTWYVSLVWV